MRKDSEKASNSSTPAAAERSEGADGEAFQANEESLEDRIRRAAYRRYEERGGTPGDSVEDWLEAERDIGQQQR